MTKRILYSVADYAEIIRDNGYFVDKTAYIAKLETIINPIFLRPRRFGKSLFCSILRYYYDISEKERFEQLFGQTWIGQNPTGKQNKFMILWLNFSVIELSSDIRKIEQNFRHYCNGELNFICKYYQLSDMLKIDIDKPVAENLANLFRYIRAQNCPPIYLIIDEYDNFANQLIISHRDQLYRQLTAEDGFFKTFFKILKQGRESGAIHNIFITGVLPIAIDDMASGFNIASFITLHPKFENMLGFTQTETDWLLDEIYREHEINLDTRAAVAAVMKNQYNGYHFVNPNGEALYNSTLVMYFLNWFQDFYNIPEYLTDLNLKTDLSWVRRLTASNSQLTQEFVDSLVVNNSIRYDKAFLTTKFDSYQFFEQSFFPISFFYLGMLTCKDDYYLQLPNLNMRTIFIEYFNQLHNIDVSTRHSEYMQAFSNNPQLEPLFAGYWREYVSQLPEAVFQKMNENFYRTTFYELCRRYLSRWFTWHAERSYPSGRSDLEFVGKFNECYAGLRWVIEFKYYSNTEFAKFKTKIENFQLQIEDTQQIAGYVEGLQTEYPSAHISQFVIYCFGNRGFRVFEIN